MKGVEANMNKYIIMLFTTTADITLTYMAPDNLCTVAGCFSTKFLACSMHGNCKGKSASVKLQIYGNFSSLLHGSICFITLKVH